MSLKTTLNYSINFNPIKRNYKQIKFIVFHYTGMKRETAAIKKLRDKKSEVSAHFFIKNNGEIITLVPVSYIAWHAGISFWKNFKSLNKYSIGIEISNPGHDLKYKIFSKKQIKSILKLSKFLIKTYKISPKNILGHSDISPSRKKDPGEKFPWFHLSKNGIGLWHSITKKKLIKNRMKKIDSKDENIFYKNLFKIGYSNKNIKNLAKDKLSNLLIIAFQRRFRQELVNGEIDKECLIISENLVKKFN